MPETIEEIKSRDLDCAEGVIEDVTSRDDGGLTLSYVEDSDGTFPGGKMGVGVAARDVPEDLAPEDEPQAGDRIRVFGRFGGRVHGIDYRPPKADDWIEIYYLIPKEREARRVEWFADHERRQREDFAEQKEKLDVDYEALPAPLKRRIDRFRSQDSDFRWQSEAYEMFACTEAVKIADHLRPKIEAGEDPEAVVRAWAELPFEKQKAVVSDGHSGNTFGGAVRLALALLTEQDV